MGSITPVPLSILRIRQFSTFLPTLKQQVEPIETGGESMYKLSNSYLLVYLSHIPILFL